MKRFTKKPLELCPHDPGGAGFYYYTPPLGETLKVEDPVIPEGTIEGREFRLVKDGGWCSRYADAPGKSGKPLGEKVARNSPCGPD